MRSFLTEEETNLIKEHFPKDGITTIAKLLPERHRQTIYGAAKRLGLKSPQQQPRYTEEEDNLLKEHYPKPNGINHLLKLLPRRNRDSLWGRAKKLGLSISQENRVYSDREVWSQKDIKILKEQYPKLGIVETQKLLPHRSETSIVSKAFNLGISVEWSEERNGSGVMPIEILKKKIKKATNGLVIILDEPWTVDSVRKGNFKCELCGHTWEAFVSNVSHHGHRCGECFGRGCNFKVPTILYYICIDGKYYKIGLTNKEVLQRCKMNIKTEIDIRIVWEYRFEDGYEALEIETDLKREFKGIFFKRGDLLNIFRRNDGQTETANFDFLGFDHNMTWRKI